MVKKAFWIAAAALSIWAAPPVDPSALQKAGMDAATLQRIPKRMQELVDRGVLSGAVTLVQRHGAVASLEAVGWADKEAKKPMRPDTIFQVMSMTKPFVGTAIMMLADEGGLSVGDRVEKHIPEFRGQMVVVKRNDDGTVLMKKPVSPITIFDLMTHSSGMSYLPPDGIKELNTTMDRTLADAVLLYSQMPLEFEPGGKWQYSNLGIAILGRIIEVRSGMSFEKFLETRAGGMGEVYRARDTRLNRDVAIKVLPARPGGFAYHTAAVNKDAERPDEGFATLHCRSRVSRLGSFR